MSFIRAFVRSCAHWFVGALVCSSIHSFFVHSLTHALTHSVIHSFNHSFICSFIHCKLHWTLARVLVASGTFRSKFSGQVLGHKWGPGEVCWFIITIDYS
jgi:hypothetical protein